MLALKRGRGDSEQKQPLVRDEEVCPPALVSGGGCGGVAL